MGVEPAVEGLPIDPVGLVRGEPIAGRIGLRMCCGLCATGEPRRRVTISGVPISVSMFSGMLTVTFCF